MNDMTNNVSGHHPYHVTTPIYRTWPAMAALSLLLVMGGTGMASAEPTPTESVKGTIADVVRILDNTELNHRAMERRR
ncbi:MAG TPA: hypothetical protein VJU54_06610, partial [Nitrospiraceae bacterium]|nr:hypothetical protein [Nitrospiraceae bacterium]